MTTEARLFDTYSGRHARRRTQRQRSSLANDDAADDDDADDDDDELTPEERDLFKLLNLPETFVGGFRDSNGESYGGVVHPMKTRSGVAASTQNVSSTRGSPAEKQGRDGSNVTRMRGDDDHDDGLRQASFFQSADAHLVPGFFLWRQAFDCEYQQYYYYRESTRQTQWEPPTQGFMPLSYEDVHPSRRRDETPSVGESGALQHAQSEKHRIPHPKYWAQRHRFFSLFDHGVRLDTEAWFSVTPERIANHQAKRCHRSLCGLDLGDGSEEQKTGSVTTKCAHRQLVVLDAFCGVAGNTIAFARHAGVRVIACDNDEARLELASHNADVYGVRNSIDFVCDDVIATMKSAVASSHRRDATLIDMIFLSPPWGGPEYLNAENFDLREQLVSGLNLIDVLKLALSVTPNVACFLPRNTDLQPLIETLSHDSSRFETERLILNGKCKAMTLYFGQLCAVR